MLQLAGTLASMPTSRVMMLWCYLACWCIALAAWREVLAPRYELIGVAIVNLMTIGGAALWYLSAEFSTLPRSSGVLISALNLAHASGFTLMPWLWSIIPALIAFAVLGGRKVAKRQENAPR
jgi:hypothetical protein